MLLEAQRIIEGDHALILIRTGDRSLLTNLLATEKDGKEPA